MRTINLRGGEITDIIKKNWPAIPLLGATLIIGCGLGDSINNLYQYVQDSANYVEVHSIPLTARVIIDTTAAGFASVLAAISVLKYDRLQGNNPTPNQEQPSLDYING